MVCGKLHDKGRGFTREQLGFLEDNARNDDGSNADKVCKGILAGTYERGILVCGTGVGMSIAANKYPGIRASLCSDCYSAQMTMEHNNSNVLCLGGRTIGVELAKMIVDTYLAASFSGLEKHARRVAMIGELEK